MAEDETPLAPADGQQLNSNSLVIHHLKNRQVLWQAFGIPAPQLRWLPARCTIQQLGAIVGRQPRQHLGEAALAECVATCHLSWRELRRRAVPLKADRARQHVTFFQTLAGKSHQINKHLVVTSVTELNELDLVVVRALLLHADSFPGLADLQRPAHRADCRLRHRQRLHDLLPLACREAHPPRLSSRSGSDSQRSGVRTYGRESPL